MPLITTVLNSALSIETPINKKMLSMIGLQINTILTKLNKTSMSSQIDFSQDDLPAIFSHVQHQPTFSRFTLVRELSNKHIKDDSGYNKFSLASVCLALTQDYTALFESTTRTFSANTSGDSSRCNARPIAPIRSGCVAEYCATCLIDWASLREAGSR